MTKKIFFLFTLIIFCNSLTLPQAGGQRFTQIRPLLDDLGNLHIFYRIHYEDYMSEYNSIYHIDTKNASDSLFLISYRYFNPPFIYYKKVWGYSFIQNDPSKFIYIYQGGYDDSDFWTIKRFDGPTSYYSYSDMVVSISVNSLVYDFVIAYRNTEKLFVSYDQGLNWELKSSSFVGEITQDPFRIGTYYFIYEYALYKTGDYWNTISLSDSNGFNSYIISRTFFDIDSNHIYYIDGLNNLRRSSNNGEPGSWETIQTSLINHEICIHDTISGILYLTDGMNLKISTDYGNSFKTFITLDETIIDLYYQTVKGNIYLATENHLIEIKNNDIVILKELNINSTETEKLYPLDYSISPNYPNPFNPVTTIKYQIPAESFISLKVYDMLGNEITTLVDEAQTVGNYQVEFDGSGLPSGIYFYRIQAGSFVETKKMVFLK